MTNKELQEKIARLEAGLAEVKEMAVAMKKKADSGVFKPEDGQEYWYISGSGEVYRQVWNYNAMDHDHYTIGNCFPTEQSAEDTVRVLKLIQKARESQDGFAPDWYNSEEIKYLLYFNRGNIDASSFFTMNVDPTLGYWRDKSECKQFISENRDELLWYFTEYRR